MVPALSPYQSPVAIATTRELSPKPHVLHHNFTRMLLCV